MRLSAATALRQEVREELAGTGGEVGLVVYKPGGKAAGETGDGAAMAVPGLGGLAAYVGGGPQAGGDVRADREKARGGPARPAEAAAAPGRSAAHARWSREWGAGGGRRRSKIWCPEDLGRGDRTVDRS
jgi:hypothetical protein